MPTAYGPSGAAVRRLPAVTVLVAMSGGVDSSVAAARVLDGGEEVVGVHLDLVSSTEAATDAKRVADHLGIRLEVWDLAATFRREVMDDFVAQYAAGRTPNPCVRCNERIKFGALVDRALAEGFDAVATGHYARVLPAGGGTPELHRAMDRDKDQSYVLGVLSADRIAAARFPVGTSTKAEVRAEAADRGLPVATKPDSVDICFIPDGDTRGWLRRHVGDRPGDIVDAGGAVVGRHTGTHGFTVGQRHGLGLDRSRLDGQPRFVVGVDAATSTVTIGTADRLAVDLIEADRPRWCDAAPETGARVGVQVRAHGEEVPARLEVRGEDVRVALERTIRGVAPGQAAVLYDGTRVLGSATIVRASRR